MPAKYVPLNDAIYHYAIAQRSNAGDPILTALQMETENMGENGRMMIGPDQGSASRAISCRAGNSFASSRISR
jgi:hypothetical protein